jgi:hypothetical protein
MRKTNPSTQTSAFPDHLASLLAPSLSCAPPARPPYAASAKPHAAEWVLLGLDGGERRAAAALCMLSICLWPFEGLRTGGPSTLIHFHLP